MVDRSRLLALGGVAGPAAFIGAWAVGGALRDGYDPIATAISRLAELGASSRPLMTAGFLVFGVGVPAFGAALKRELPGPAWMTAVATGLATLGVAATPLGTESLETAHGIFAGLGYATLAATPLLAAGPLRRLGRRRAATLSTVAGATSAALLAATVALDGAHGFFQRAGLGAGDVWVIWAAASIARGRGLRPTYR